MCAPFKKVKFTRSPPLWMKDIDIRKLGQKQHHLRYKDHQNQTTYDQGNFRRIRNKLKTKDKRNKDELLQNGFFDKNGKDI